MLLAYVLWGLALLMLLASSLLPSASGSYRLAHLVVEEAQIEAQTDGVVNTAILRLLDPRPEQRWRADGTVRDIRFDSIQARVSIREEAGRLDINQANKHLLERLLVWAGLDSETASSLADRIVYWRDERALPLEGDSFSAQVAAARRGPFQSLDELRLVPGMTASVFERIEPVVTVYSGRPTIDPRLVARDAHGVLRAVFPDTAPANEAARPIESSPLGMAPSFDGRALRIRADLSFRERQRSVEVVVRLTGDPRRLYWILDRRQR